MTLLDLAREIGLDPKKEASTAGGEYHCSCPVCGGSDRFRLQPNRAGKRCTGFYACRQCKRSDGKDLAGDTISFCIDVMGMNPLDAYERLNAKRPEKTFFKAAVRQSFVPASITPPNRKWQEKAASFIDWSHQQILKQQDILSALEKRGLPLEAVQKYKIGWCHNPKGLHGNFVCERKDWGLPEELDDKGETKKVYLPKGIVVPTLENDGSVVRIKIRRSDWTPESEFPKYKAIPGSMKGMNIIGNTSNPVMVVVESELDAYALEFACSDFAFSIAVGSNTKNPDNVTDHLAKKKTLLICRDNDDAGKTMFYKWRKLYSHASDCPTPVGKDIGEAIQNDFEIRKWLLEQIRTTGDNNGI